jgi:hypothetical protein
MYEAAWHLPPCVNTSSLAKACPQPEVGLIVQLRKAH